MSVLSAPAVGLAQRSLCDEHWPWQSRCLKGPEGKNRRVPENHGGTSLVWPALLGFVVRNTQQRGV